MNCRETENALQKYLDGRTSSVSATIREHMTDCPDCRELYQAAQELTSALEALPRPQVGSLLTQQIVASVQKDQARIQRTNLRFRQSLGGLAFAAAILLSVLSYLVIPQFWEATPSKQPIAKEKAVANDGPQSIPAQVGEAAPRKPEVLRPHKDPNQDLSPEEELRVKFVEAGSAVVKLQDKLAKQTQEQAKLLWKVAQADNFPKLTLVVKVDPAPNAINPASKSLQQAGAGVTTGFRTVTDSAQRAVSYFARTIPPVARQPQTVQ
ncbi:MAG: zf-HC2 domain-containing protein [Gemmataceae bacterium]